MRIILIIEEECVYINKFNNPKEKIFPKKKRNYGNSVKLNICTVKQKQKHWLLL